MKKIRNFKLQLPFKDIRHKARRKFDLAKMGLDDVELQKFLKDCEARMAPAVIYETFGADSEDTAELAAIKGLARTLGLANLGPGPAEMLTEVAEISQERAKFLEMVFATALSRAVVFVTRLIKDDVEADRCELAPIQYIEAPEHIAKVYEKLDGKKIELTHDEGRLSPEHATAFCLSWMLKRRAKKKPKAKR